jgi:hypothetical protein
MSQSRNDSPHRTTYTLSFPIRLLLLYCHFYHSLSLSICCNKNYCLGLILKRETERNDKRLSKKLAPHSIDSSLSTHSTMLVLPLKTTSRYEDFAKDIAHWLDNADLQVSFATTNPLEFVVPKPDLSSCDCWDDLVRAQSLRNDLGSFGAYQLVHLDDAREYHACLVTMERRGFVDISTLRHLTWSNAEYRTSANNKPLATTSTSSSSSETHTCLTWERACVAYNIAALLSDKAAHDCNANDRSQVKLAVSYCQQAASILAVLQELVPAMTQFQTVDLSVPLLQFWQKYFVAEAQGFIYRMVAVSDDQHEKPALLAGLARSAHSLFRDALSAAVEPRLQSERTVESNEWAAYCKACSMLQASKASFHSAAAHRLAYEWGKEIARLRECLQMLESCRDFMKTLPADGPVGALRRECVNLLPVVKDRMHEADKDNYKIYQEVIPREMPEIEAKQMVKTDGGLPESMLVPKRPMFSGL